MQKETNYTGRPTYFLQEFPSRLSIVVVNPCPTISYLTFQVLCLRIAVIEVAFCGSNMPVEAQLHGLKFKSSFSHKYWGDHIRYMPRTIYAQQRPLLVITSSYSPL